MAARRIMVSVPASGINYMTKRQTYQTESLRDRLDSFAKTAREIAGLLPPGAEKDELLRKAQRAETVACLSQSKNSCALRRTK